MLAAAACGFLLICKHAICALFWISCVGNKVLKTIYRQKGRLLFRFWIQ